MQDNIIASHTFGGHSVKPVYKLSNVPDDLKWTTNTIYTHLQGITNNIYSFGRPFFAPSFSYHPYSFLPVQMTGGRVSA